MRRHFAAFVGFFSAFFALSLLLDVTIFARRTQKDLATSRDGQGPSTPCPFGVVAPTFFGVALDGSVPVPSGCLPGSGDTFVLPTTAKYPDRSLKLQDSGKTFTVQVSPALWGTQTTFLVRFSSTNANLRLVSLVIGRNLDNPQHLICALVNGSGMPFDLGSTPSSEYCTNDSVNQAFLPASIPVVPSFADSFGDIELIEPTAISAADGSTTRWDQYQFAPGSQSVPTQIALLVDGLPNEFETAGKGNGLLVSDFDQNNPNFLAVVADTTSGAKNPILLAGDSTLISPVPVVPPPAPAYDLATNAKVISSPVFSEVVDVTNALPNLDSNLSISGAQNDPLAPTDDGSVPCGSSGFLGLTLLRTVWYSYTPTRQDAIHINTSKSRYDTYLAVFAGSSSGTLLKHNDDQTGPPALVHAKLDYTPALSDLTKPLLIMVGESPAYGCNASTLQPLPLSNDATLYFSLVQDVPPTSSFSPTTLTFMTPQLVGSTSNSQPLVVTNTGASNLVISKVAPTMGFSETDDCTTAPVAPAGTCTINVSFSPQTSGVISGSLTITDNEPNAPPHITVSGTGVDFTFPAPTSTTGTLTSTTNATYTFNVSGSAAFSGSIAFDCSGLPSNTKCSFNPNPAMPGAGTTQVALTVSRISNTAFLDLLPTALNASIGITGFLFCWALRRSQRNVKMRFALASLMLIGVTLAIAACGGSSYNAPPPPPLLPTAGNYQFTATATVNGAPTKSVSLTLTVQ